MSLALHPQTVVARFPRWTLAVNVNQNLLGKTILALNRSATSVTELTGDELVDMRDHIAATERAVRALFEPGRFNHAFLMNADAHVHLHVVPRYAAPREWRGELFHDPWFGELFGREVRHLSTDALARLRDELRDELRAAIVRGVAREVISSDADLIERLSE